MTPIYSDSKMTRSLLVLASLAVLTVAAGVVGVAVILRRKDDDE